MKIIDIKRFMGVDLVKRITSLFSLTYRKFSLGFLGLALLAIPAAAGALTTISQGFST